MENMVVLDGEQESMDLPPGFRFHPTDEELITHYLSFKVVDTNFCARAIGEVDLNKCEPWDLPKRAKMGEKEWYFFCLRDRKYPTGLRTNRATEAGYWKATGKDKEIYRGKSLVGMKKTLVFYKGRAPKGVKSNWVMHEYRLEGKSSLQNLPSNAKNEWVICRVFQKSASGKKIPFSTLIQSNSSGIEFNPSTNLPPLMESSPYNTHHVSCFSNSMETAQPSHSHYQPIDQPSFNGLNNHPYTSIPLNPGDNNSYYTRFGGLNPYFPPQTGPYSGPYSDQRILQAIIENNGGELKQSMKTEVFNYSASQDTCLSSDLNNAEISSVVSNHDISRRPFDDLDGPSTSVGPLDMDSIWNNY
ncbi:unnamed protein product [Amaranthus hypochondriacus]